MKKTFIVLLLVGFSCLAFGLSAQEIVDKMEKSMQVEQSIMEYEQVVITAGGVKTSYTVEAYSKNANEKQLTRYLAPSKVKGTAFLMLNNGDDIWAYFSSTGRVRLIAKHTRNQKMMVSEFTYEDMSMRDYKDKYTATLLADKKVQRKDCYQVKLIPLASSSYSHIIVFIDKQDFVGYRIDFYQKGSPKAFKTLLQAKVKKVQGIMTPHLIVMKNHQTGAQTAMKITKVEYNKKLPDSMFTTTFLKK